MNKTLNSLFPDTPVYENKIIKFLETCYNYAWSYRATAKELSINHKTVKNILESHRIYLLKSRIQELKPHNQKAHFKMKLFL